MSRDDLIEELKKLPTNADVKIRAFVGDESIERDVDRIQYCPNPVIIAEI